MKSVTKLLAMAIDGRRGRHWYSHVNTALREYCMLYGFDPNLFAAILGITSPRVHVSRNLHLTAEYMRLRKYVNIDDVQFTHRQLDGLMPMVRSGLERYELEGAITGPKTSAFAGACLGDLSQVVLDTWMAKALGVPQAKFKSRAVREKATDRINEVADMLSWEPAEVQAAIWTAAIEADAKRRNAPCLATMLRTRIDAFKRSQQITLQQLNVRTVKVERLAQ